jgi:hypothetical protein
MPSACLDSVVKLVQTIQKVSLNNNLGTYLVFIDYFVGNSDKSNSDGVIVDDLDSNENNNKGEC